METECKLFIEKLKEMPDFNRVKFAMIYGSHASKKNNKLSDIDFAVFYDGNKHDRFKFKLKLMAKLPDKYDVQIFQDLPLFVRKDVLKGKLIYAKEESFAYETAYQTIRDFDYFKKAYYDYIGMEAIT